MTFSPSPGTTVGGRFVLDERLASGGFATVWRATDDETGAAVAVKCGSDATHDRAAVRDRFRRELHWFRRLAGGPSPGSLVRFVDGAVHDAAYVATELVDGGALDAHLADGDASPGVEALDAVGAPVCRAVEFLHRVGVCYLDLKPGNVLVRRDGTPALVDLNAAVPADGGTATLFHPDPFKPPELTPTELRDRQAGTRSDVYSLGKLLAYLLTGETVAFPGESVDRWQPVDPRDLGADPPDPLAAPVRRATEPDPADRFADAAELADALWPHLDGPDRTAFLADPGSERRVRVRPGATLGRWSPGEPVPTVVLADDDRHVSPVHATVAHWRGQWYLRDRSDNGTFVRRDGRWEYVLSRDGLERRQAAGRPPPVPGPDASVHLADGDRIAPVDPEYGVELRFDLG